MTCVAVMPDCCAVAAIQNAVPSSSRSNVIGCVVEVWVPSAADVIAGAVVSPATTEGLASVPVRNSTTAQTGVVELFCR